MGHEETVWPPRTECILAHPHLRTELLEIDQFHSRERGSKPDAGEISLRNEMTTQPVRQNLPNRPQTPNRPAVTKANLRSHHFRTVNVVTHR